MDVNGFKGPNSEARNGKQYDIRSFKVAKFSKGCAGNNISGIGCVYQLPSYSPIKAGSDEMKKWDPKWNKSGYTIYDNYWAGAKKACDELGMSLPDRSKLLSLYKASQKDSSLGLPTSDWFWSSSEDSTKYVYYVGFSNGDTSNSSKSDSIFKVLCVGD